VAVPATALAQAIRNPAKQARLSRPIRQGNGSAAFDGPDATAVGLLLAKTGTADLADAHVSQAIWNMLPQPHSLDRQTSWMRCESRSGYGRFGGTTARSKSQVMR
jgi:hypothetical protein